jgi:hypothetical protein
MRDDRGAAHLKNIPVTGDDVAYHGIVSRAGNAGAREHDLGHELAIGDVQGATGHGRRAGTQGGECTQAFGAEKRFAVDFEFRIVSRLHGHAAEVAVPVMERAQRDDVYTRRFVDLEQRSAYAHRLLVDRRNLCHDERFGRRRCGRRYDVDQVRGSQVEIELQQRRQAAAHCQLVAVGQPDPEFRLLQRRAGSVRDDRLFRAVSGGDEHFCVAVVEADRARNVGRGRDRRDRNELGQVDIVGEVDASFARQRLHHAAVGRFERQ